MALCLLYYYRMCAADMTHVEANLPADIDKHLRPFATLDLTRVEKIAAMGSADMPEALAADELDLDGTLPQQKHRLFDSFLCKWEARVNDTYAPKDEAAKQLFSAAIDVAVGVLKADWAAFSVSTGAPSSAAGAGAGGVAPEVPNPTHYGKPVPCSRTAID